MHLSFEERRRVQRIMLSDEQVADIRTVLDLVQGRNTKKVIADKAYEADWLLRYLNSEGIETVIPSKVAVCDNSRLTIKVTSSAM